MYTDTITAWVYHNSICCTDLSKFKQSCTKLLKHLVLMHPEIKACRQTVWREVQRLGLDIYFPKSASNRPSATDTDGLQRDVPGAQFTDGDDDHDR